METQRTFSEWLDDLCVRFLVNLPNHELAEFSRIGGHIEEAHWFYLDFIQALDPSLPALNLKTFSLHMFAHCPLTQHCTPDILDKGYHAWRDYKKIIPVGGLILLNEAMDSVLLVRGFAKGSSWMFPRGKFDEHEEDLACAVREAYEETGFDAKKNGLVPHHGGLKKLEQHLNGQKVMLFVVPNVPMDFPFAPKARKEIGDIRWYKLADLPGWTRRKKGQDPGATAPKGLRAFQVSPFLGELSRWVREQRKMKDRARPKHSNGHGHLSQAELDDGITEEDEGLVAEEVTATLPSTEAQEAFATDGYGLPHMPLSPQGPQAAYSADQNRLLSQGPRTATYSVDQDRGKALLALLHQKQDPSQQSPHIVQPSPYGPHTPMNHIHNVVLQPHTPHHHKQTQRLPPQSNQQAAPLYSPQPADVNNQLLSVLGISKPPLDQPNWQQAQNQNQQQPPHHQQVANHQVFNHQQTVNQQQVINSQQALNQQRAMGSTPGTVAHRTPLAHPQPLPPQANHILTGAVQSPAVSNNTTMRTQQQQSQFGISMPGLFNLPQQLLARPPPRREELDKNSLALLSVFKRDRSPADGAASKTTFPYSEAAENVRPSQEQPSQQSANETGLGSPYAGAPRPHIVMQNGLQGAPMSHISPQLAIAKALRPRKTTPLQQNTLLSLLGQTSGLSPRVEDAQPTLKENGAPYLPTQGHSQQQRFASFASGLEPVPTMPQDPTRGSHVPQMADGAQPLALRPKTVEQRTPQQQFATHSAQQLGAFRVDGASSDSRNQVLGSPLIAYAGGSPYFNPASPAQVGLQTPLLRQQEANPQRQQALLSLFGKSPAAAAPVPRDEERRPTSSSQTPISPANEKFLLAYLNGVTGSAK